MNFIEFPKSAQKVVKRASDYTFFATPDNPTQAILWTLAKNGPMTLADLVKTIGNYGEWEANHDTIKRRIEGLPNHVGLKEYEFIKERTPKKRRPGKYGKVYCLSTKGFLASLATGLSFSQIDMFKKYKEFLEKRLTLKIKYIGMDAGFDSTLDQKTKELLLNLFVLYIKYQMAIFLIWHEANETSIMRKRNSNLYIEDFFNLHSEYIHQEFPMLLENENQYKEILRKYFLVCKIIHGIDEFTDSKNKHHKKIKDNFSMIKSFVFNWYLYFDTLQMENQIGESYDIRKIPSVIFSRPEFGIEIEYFGKPGEMKKIQPDIRSEASNEIQKILGKPVQIKQIWRTLHSKKSF